MVNGPGTKNNPSNPVLPDWVTGNVLWHMLPGLPVPGILAYGRGNPKIPVYRGTNFGDEIRIADETGRLMSDAARRGYVESGGSVSDALRASREAHSRGLAEWGSPQDLIEAHAEFGTEMRREFGDRSMFSTSTDWNVAKSPFADEGGHVFGAMIRQRGQGIFQTLATSGESEVLIPHMVPAVKDVGPGWGKPSPAQKLTPSSFKPSNIGSRMGNYLANTDTGQRLIPKIADSKVGQFGTQAESKIFDVVDKAKSSNLVTSIADSKAGNLMSKVAASPLGKYGGKALGAAGVGLSVYDDLENKHYSVAHTAVREGVGLGAAIATGAAIGTAIPIPMVGTVVGAVGGAVVGLVASGAVDKLADTKVGKAVDHAISTGEHAVVHGVEHGASTAWHTVSNWFSEGGAVKGDVKGPGSSIGDKIPAYLSDGEFVVNAASASANRPLLKAINDDPAYMAKFTRQMETAVASQLTQMKANPGARQEHTDQSMTVNVSAYDVHEAFSKAKLWQQKREMLF